MKNTNNDSVPSICDLRRAGYKVRVSHFRNIPVGQLFDSVSLMRVTKIDKKKRMFENILEHGGETQIEITNRDGKTFNAVAQCSNKDAFNRKLGNHICLARLKKQGAF